MSPLIQSRLLMPLLAAIRRALNDAREAWS